VRRNPLELTFGILTFYQYASANGNHNNWDRVTDFERLISFWMERLCTH